MSDKSSPIGIFDSGLGGLTVVKRILEKLPDESVVYVGDTARIPYGPKSPTVIQDFSRQLSRFLLGRDVKAIVVACNTASAFGLSVLSEFVEVPVLGVVGPSARAAAAASSSGRIGVIGTKGTIGSEAYQNAILTINPEARVFARPAPLLVPMIEEGHHDDEIVRLALGMYLDDLLDQKVDTLVLGCTHYPLLIDTIQKFVGDDVTVVDSAGAAADELAA
ncbi:MAG: glutamate racemase, partial [Candidatus Lindowbacteria bacterium]|nr:glutamate racemase [Candidatus Lindowbacteria bacterium]